MNPDQWMHTNCYSLTSCVLPNSFIAYILVLYIRAHLRYICTGIPSQENGSLHPPSSVACPLAMASAIDETIGTIFIGVVLCSMLWAGGCIQSYNFFMLGRYSIYWKAFILFVLVLETVHIALFIDDLKTHLITHFGDVKYAQKLARSFPAQIVLQDVAVFTVQGLITYRVFRFHERSMVVAVPLFILILVHLVTGIAYAVQITTVNSYEDLGTLTVIPIVYAICATATGVMLTGLLMALLYRSRHSPRLRENDPMAPRDENLTHYLPNIILTSGLVPTCFSVAYCSTFIGFIHGTHSWVFSALFAMTGLLWFNNLLAALNSRFEILDMDDSSGYHASSPSKGGKFFARASSRSLTIDTNGVQDDLEVGPHNVAELQRPKTRPILGLVTDPDLQPQRAIHTDMPVLDYTTAARKTESPQPPTPPEKDTPLARRLSRALSRTFRKSISGSNVTRGPPRRPAHPRRPSAAGSTIPLSSSECRELGPPLSPPPGEPLPPLPLPLSVSVPHSRAVLPYAPIADSFARAPPPSVVSDGSNSPVVHVNTKAGNSTSPPLVKIVPRQYGSTSMHMPDTTSAPQAKPSNLAVPLEIERSRIPLSAGAQDFGVRSIATALSQLEPTADKPQNSPRPLRALPIPPPLYRSMST